MRFQARNVVALENSARYRLIYPGYNVKYRGLSCAVGPYYTRYLSLTNGQIELINSGEPPKVIVSLSVVKM